MINLKVLNKALSPNVKGDEFMVLYFIANMLSFAKKDKVTINRDYIGKRLGMSAKKVTTCTNALVKKGFLKKTLTREGKKTLNVYALSEVSIWEGQFGKVKTDPLKKKNLEKNLDNNNNNIKGRVRNLFKGDEIDTSQDETILELMAKRLGI